MWENFYIQCKIDQNITVESEIPNNDQDKEISAYDFLTENLTGENTKNKKISKPEENEIVKKILDKSKTKDRNEGIKIVETVQSVVGAFDENEIRNKNRKIINESVIESYRKIDDCINRLNEGGKEYEKLKETITEIEKTIDHLKSLKELIILNIK